MPATLDVSCGRSPRDCRGSNGTVLGGRGLEIVDDQGRVRAMIKVFPPDPMAKMPDGALGYVGARPRLALVSKGWHPWLLTAIPSGLK